jgi:hypothetical protein
MNPLDLRLVAIGLAGIVMLFILFSKRFPWNWTKYRAMPYRAMPPEEAASIAPFWLGLITALSLAAILFSIHALLVVHGVLR